MEDVSVIYHSFSPSDFAKTYFQQLANRIADESPSSSHVRITISQKDEAYKGFVQVTSAAGRFHAVANEGNIFDLSHTLFKQIHHQLDRWKSRRHSRETLRHLEFDEGKEVYNETQSA